jgi:hypothetical protein
MNEINPKMVNIKTISSVEPDINQNKSLQKGDGAFGQILIDQIKKDHKDTVLEKTAPLAEIEGTFKAQQLNLEFNQSQFTQKMNASLNLLEAYASLLQDPDKTLKQAYDLLERVSTQTRALAREFKDDKTSSNDLKQILTHLMTVVEVEQIKFSRGDYL